MLLITNLSFVFSAVNIMSFYDKIIEDKDTVLKMQKEICDAGRNLVCLTFKFNSQIETSDNFFNFIQSSLLNSNFNILNKQVEIIYYKDQNEIKNNKDQFKNLFLSIILKKFHNINQSNQNLIKISIEKNTITRENFVSYIKNDSKIICFNEIELTTNENIFISKEFKLNYNSMIQKNEKLFIFICKNNDNTMLDTPSNGNRRMFDVYSKYKFEFEEVLVFHNSLVKFDKLRNWDRIFMCDKYYTDKLKKKKKLLNDYFDRRWFVNNRNFTYNTLYFDLIADFQFCDVLDSEKYSRIKQFMQKDILNDVHRIKIDITFGKTLSFILILFRIKIEKLENIYNETIRVLFEENEDFSFFDYTYLVEILNEENSKEDFTSKFIKDLRLTSDNISEFFDSDDSDVSNSSMMHDERCPDCFYKKYGNVVDREIFDFEDINRNFYYGNLLDENQSIKFNRNTNFFYYINDEKDLAKYDFFLNKYKFYQKKFFKIYTKENAKKENLFSVFIENLFLLKKNLYGKFKIFEFDVRDLICKNFYFFLLNNIIDLKARKLKFLSFENIESKIIENLSLKYSIKSNDILDLCFCEKLTKNNILQQVKLFYSIKNADVQKIKHFYNQNLVTSLRYKFSSLDSIINVFIFSFEPKNSNFINFCEKSYSMAAMTVNKNVDEIIKRFNLFFATDTICYVIEKIINHFSECEFYALYINYEFFSLYFDILIKLNILKFEYINRCYRNGIYNYIDGSLQLHKEILDDYLKDQKENVFFEDGDEKNLFNSLNVENIIEQVDFKLNKNLKCINNVIPDNITNDILMKEITNLQRASVIYHYDVKNCDKYKKIVNINDLKFKSLMITLQNIFEEYFSNNLKNFIKDNVDEKEIILLSYKIENLKKENINEFCDDFINTMLG